MMKKRKTKLESKNINLKTRKGEKESKQQKEEKMGVGAEESRRSGRRER